MGTFAEAGNFLRDVSVSAVLLTGRCLMFELFSYVCLKNREAGDKEWESGELKGWLQIVSTKENYIEKEKVSTVYTYEKQKNVKFALKKKCHILQSSSIYWADQSRSSKSIYYYIS